jgi:hypothetical protein
MINFNGPKYQQGKIGGDHAPTSPDAVVLAHKLARKAKVSSITIGDEEMLYVYIDLGKRNSYGVAYKKKLVDTVGKLFEEQIGCKAIIGFYELNFTPVSQREAFKIKLGDIGI